MDNKEKKIVITRNKSTQFYWVWLWKADKNKKKNHFGYFSKTNDDMNISSVNHIRSYSANNNCWLYIYMEKCKIIQLNIGNYIKEI